MAPLLSMPLLFRINTLFTAVYLKLTLEFNHFAHEKGLSSSQRHGGIACDDVYLELSFNVLD